MNILIAPDNNVIGPTCVLLNSLRSNHPDTAINLYVLWCDLSADNVDALNRFAGKLGIEVIELNLDPEKISRTYDRLPRRNLTRTALLRCFAGEMVPQDVDRLLYLDTDTIVAGPVCELYETPLAGCIAGAALNPGPTHLTEFGVGEERYFNSGVLLIDMEQWRQHDIDRKLREFLQQHPEKCPFFDQCALNVVLAGQTVTLDPRWNVMGCLKDEVAYTNVSIIHYAGDVKPWLHPERHPFGINYCNYSRNTPWPTRYRYKKLRPDNPFIFRARRLVETNSKKIKALLANTTNGRLQ